MAKTAPCIRSTSMKKTSRKQWCDYRKMHLLCSREGKTVQVQDSSHVFISWFTVCCFSSFTGRINTHLQFSQLIHQRQWVACIVKMSASQSRACLLLLLNTAVIPIVRAVIHNGQCAGIPSSPPPYLHTLLSGLSDCPFNFKPWILCH